MGPPSRELDDLADSAGKKKKKALLNEDPKIMIPKSLLLRS